MKILFPKNIFSQMLFNVLPDDLKNNVEFKDAPLLASALEAGDAQAALIPSCDLLKHKDLFVSSKVFIGYDGMLSDSYIYFVPGQKSLDELFLAGDVTTNEIILSKILFKERYSTDISLHLINYDESALNRNILLAGDNNFKGERYKKGLSFADEISTMLFLPYVNFVLASKDDKILELFNHKVKSVDSRIDESLDLIFKDILPDENLQDFITDNIMDVYFEMTSNEQDALNELLQLPYYHGIFEDIPEIRYV